jgi:hypothetical protein
MKEYQSGDVIRSRKVRMNPWFRLLLFLGFTLVLARTGTTVITISTNGPRPVTNCGHGGGPIK